MTVCGSDAFARLETGLRDLPYPASFRPFSAYEAGARSLRLFEHVLVPGLLQTAGYARAVLSTRPHTSADEIEELVTARLARQALLARADPPRLYVLLDEGVLHRPARPRYWPRNWPGWPISASRPTSRSRRSRTALARTSACKAGSPSRTCPICPVSCSLIP